MPYVGQALRRFEDPRFLRGEGRFVADHGLPRALEAVFLRSPHAHARLRRLDVEGARRRPGVAAVLTAADIGELGVLPSSLESIPAAVRAWLRPEVKTLRWPLLVESETHYAGEPFAVLVAEDRYRAEDAAAVVEADWEALPAVTDPWAALEWPSPRVHADQPDNVAADLTLSFGDVDAAFAGAAGLVEEEYTVQRYVAAAIETRGVLAEWDSRTGGVHLRTSTQMPHVVRKIACRLLGLPEGSLRVSAPDVGGGFGSKGSVYPEEVLCVHLARTLRRSVRWIADRREDLQSTMHGRDQRHRVRAAYDGRGRILAVDDTCVLDGGAYAPWGILELANTAVHLPGCYRLENYRFHGRRALTHKTPCAPYRGSGRPEAVFVMDRLLQTVAWRLGMDAADVWRANLIPGEAMPYRLHGVPYRDGEPIVYDGGDYRACFEKLLELIDYPGWRRRAAERSGPRRIGVGFSCMVEGSGKGPYETARVRVADDGGVTLYSGGAPHGQGYETTLRQVVADALGAPLDRCQVFCGDTADIAEGEGTWGNRGAPLAGSAAWLAALRVRDKLARLAAALWEARPEDVLFVDGCATLRGVPERRLTFAELSRASRPGSGRPLPPGIEAGLDEQLYFSPPTVTWTNSAHAAVAEVDVQTGAVRLLDYAVVHDCGRVINPLVVAGQVQGGVAQGVGGAMLEWMRHGADGQVLSGSFLDYLPPSSAEVPRVRLFEFETPTDRNPLGAKGMGEGGALSPPPAIANAVADALGAEVAAMPLTPEAVAGLLSARSSGGC